MFSKLNKLFGMVAETLLDAFVFIRYNSYSPFVDESKRAFYKIIIEAHTIEKGLSLKAPKPLFGREKIRFVMMALSRYNTGHSTVPAHMALGALDAYVSFHSAIGVVDPLLDEIALYLKGWEEKLPKPWRGGIKRHSFTESSIPDLGGLLASRSSIRNFSTKTLETKLVYEAIAMAQLAPSQCNRQSTQVHIYQDSSTIGNLLALQGGSRGFVESVGNLFIVSSEVCAWGGPGQRNQTYVDGALFAMCLMLACRLLGWGTCPLNLAVSHKTEREIRRVGGIPDGERLVMMIAFGEPLTSETTVACSPRRPVTEISTLHV